MDDLRGALERLKAQMEETEIAVMASVKVIGFTTEGIAIGALLINSCIDPSKRSPEMMDCQYPLLSRHYPGILDPDSWLDCSDIFELSKQKVSERKGRLKGCLTEDDRSRVLEFLRETDVFDNITKRRLGLL